MLATTQVESTSLQVDDFWLAHAWNQESLDVLEEAFREWDVPRISVFMYAWCEFIDTAATLNPAWLPPLEYATRMARLAYAKQEHLGANPSDEDLIRKGLLPLTIANFQPEWVKHLEEFPYVGSHITLALANPTLTTEAVTRIVNRKQGSSFLLDHTVAFSWLNAAKHPNTSKGTLLRLAFRKVPQFASFYRVSNDSIATRLAQIECQSDNIFLDIDGIPRPFPPSPGKGRKKVNASTQRWEQDFDKKIAAALLSREDLPWVARRFLEHKGYKETLPEACSVQYSPVFSQAYVAGMWDDAGWEQAGNHYVDSIPSGLRVSTAEGHHQGAVFAPLIPGRSNLAVRLLVYVAEWLAPDSRRDMYPVSHKAFPYLGGMLQLVRERATRDGFESAEDVPLEWLLELFPTSTPADLAVFAESAPKPQTYGSLKGRRSATDLVALRNDGLSKDWHQHQGLSPVRFTGGSILAELNEYYFNSVIALARKEADKDA